LIEKQSTEANPNAVDAEVIAENQRSIEHQLASLRFFDLRTATPTFAGIILFGKDTRQWLPNHYVQYVRYLGTDMSGDILRERRLDGDLLSMLREIRELSEALVEMRPSTDDVQETMISNYPSAALREFIFNAVMQFRSMRRRLFECFILMTGLKYKIRGLCMASPIQRIPPIKPAIEIQLSPKP
jgi:predicted HTH transcriptional regulator